MHFDPIKLVERFESTSPALTNKLTILALNFMSPFNAHLHAKIASWTKAGIQINLNCHRGVKNHVGSIHAGALFTLGETCAGLVLIRNFSFEEHRPLMSEVSVVYEKQARQTVHGKSEISEEFLSKARKSLKKGEVPFIPMVTQIVDDQGLKIAEVKTVWQIKPWNQVRVKK
jgi:acyl-coenzyme A thioesterase PaaI-like protein